MFWAFRRQKRLKFKQLLCLFFEEEKMVLTGFRFSPTDEEIIEILIQKVSGNTAMTPLDFIVERNIYELEPQDLQCLITLNLLFFWFIYVSLVACLRSLFCIWKCNINGQGSFSLKAIKLGVLSVLGSCLSVQGNRIPCFIEHASIRPTIV